MKTRLLKLFLISCVLILGFNNAEAATTLVVVATGGNTNGATTNSPTTVPYGQSAAVFSFSTAPSVNTETLYQVTFTVPEATGNIRITADMPVGNMAIYTSQTPNYNTSTTLTQVGGTFASANNGNSNTLTFTATAGQTILTTAPYYFLVMNFTTTTALTTLPDAFTFTLTSVTANNGAVGATGDNGTGSAYTFTNAALTEAQLPGGAASLTPNPLNGTQTNVALFGMSLTSTNGNSLVTSIDFTSTRNVSTYFTGTVSLYSSTTQSTYPGSSLTGLTLVKSMAVANSTTIDFTALSQTINNGTPVYYYVVMSNYSPPATSTTFGVNLNTNGITATNTTVTYGTLTGTVYNLNAEAPTLTYTSISDVYGTAIPTTTPNYGTGGTPAACTITVPGGGSGGLAVSTAGVITGTPKLTTGTTVGTIVYTITNSNSAGTGTPATFTVTVTPAPLTITANNQTKVYGSANPTLTVTYTGLVNGDTQTSLTTQPTVTTTAVTGSPVSPPTYPITATGAVDGNYSPISYVAGALTITAKALTVTGLTAVNKTYDGTTTATFTGGTLVGVISPDVVTLIPSGTFATKNVGTGIVVTSTSTLGGANASNYTLTQPTGLTANITTKNLTITGLTANNKTYDGTTTATFTGGTLVGVISPDVVTFTTTGNFATANAGTNIAVTPNSVLGGAGAGNYTVTQVTGLTATINPAALSITTNSITEDVGIYMPFTVTYSGFVNGETSANLTTLPTITSTGTTTSPPGTYPITASGAVDGNYTITYHNTGILTIDASGTHTYTWDWTAAASTAWETPLNWDINGVQQTTDYPGSATNKDVVDVGVNYTYTSTKGPVVSSTVTVASVLFYSDNGATQVGLTVNGTLSTTGDITVQADNAIFSNALTLSLSGTGTLNVADLNIINNNTILSFETTYISSSVAALNVSKNISLATTAAFLAEINSEFLLTAGTATVAGTLTSNNSPGLLASTQSTFSITPTSTALLNLSNANALNLDNNTSVIDFNHTGSTVNYTGTTATQTVYTSNAPNATGGVAYYNLTLSGTATETPESGTLTISNNLTNSANTTFAANNPTVNIGGTWTNTGTALCGSGTITTGGAYSNSSAGTLTCGSGTLIFKGGYTNSGTFTASTGTVDFYDTQTLLDNSLKGTTFNNVTFNSGTATINYGSVTGNFAVSSTSVLTMVGTAKLVAGTTTTGGAGYLTLMSNASGSASIATIPSGASITGNINIQRYLKGGNPIGYRLLSSPVNTSTAGTGNISLAYLDATAYFGGTQYNGALTGGPNNTQFSTTGVYGTPTIYLYNESLATNNGSYTGGKTAGVTAITSSNVNVLSNGVTTTGVTIPAGNGYFLYFVGDNTVSFYSQTPNDTYMTATGFLNQQNVPVKIWWSGSTSLSDASTGASAGYNLVGNPYASTIDLSVLYTDNKTISANNTYSVFSVLSDITDNYYSYDASMSGTAGYQSLTYSQRYIGSGQGFMVKAISASPVQTITFEENQKITTVALNNIGSTPASDLALRTNLNNVGSTGATSASLIPSSEIAYMHIKFAKDSVHNNEVCIAFNSQWSDKYDALDAPYINGSQTVLSSLTSDGVATGINKLGDYTHGKRVRLNVSGADALYSLSMEDIGNIDTSVFTVFLIDNYLKDSVDMVQNKTYSFNITNADTSSFGSNRFVVAVERRSLPAYQLITFTGQKANRGVQLDWSTVNEGTYTGFGLQKQGSGGRYTTIDSLQSNGGGNYDYTDMHPVTGSNVYRLEQNDINGNVTYSKPVTIIFNSGAPGGMFTIYPSPAKALITVNVISTTAAIPNYISNIYNTAGALIAHRSVNTNTWTEDVSAYKPGIYIIALTTNDGNLVGKSKFVKTN